MTKKYLADTNIVLHNPKILSQYDCVIPTHVNREIEHLELTRKQDRQLQLQIRELKRELDSVDFEFSNLKDYTFTLNDEWDGKYVDNILVQICVEEGYGMITGDRALRTKCKQYGVEVIRPENVPYVENKGFKEFSMSEREIDMSLDNETVNSLDLAVNEYAIINDVKDGELIDIVKWDGKLFKSLRDENGKLGEGFRTIKFGKFAPLDEHQIMAIDSIFNNQITCIRGNAGSGKSLVALNTAWRLVEEEGYKLVILCNPTPLMDSQEMGYYKGDRLDKLIQSIGTMLISKFGSEEDLRFEILNGRIDILPFVDIRGYDTGETNTVVWIPEGQNLSSPLLKIGLQRLSQTAKCIVDGDFHAQVDKNIYSTDNGMKRMSEIFRGNELYGEVELQNVWRSDVAKIADLM